MPSVVWLHTGLSIKPWVQSDAMGALDLILPEVLRIPLRYR